MIVLIFHAILIELTYDGGAGEGALSGGVFWFIPVFAFEYFLLVGWLAVADALGNPFRSLADDYGWENLVKGLHVSSLLLVSEFRDDESDKQPEDIEMMLSERCQRWSHVSLLDPPKPRSHEEGIKDKRRLLTGF